MSPSTSKGWATWYPYRENILVWDILLLIWNLDLLASWLKTLISIPIPIYISKFKDVIHVIENKFRPNGIIDVNATPESRGERRRPRRWPYLPVQRPPWRPRRGGTTQITGPVRNLITLAKKSTEGIPMRETQGRGKGRICKTLRHAIFQS